MRKKLFWGVKAQIKAIYGDKKVDYIFRQFCYYPILFFINFLSKKLNFSNYIK